MAEIIRRWTPPSHVRSHMGGHIPPESIFFAPPPIEIGPVLSAQSGVYTYGSAVGGPIPRKVIGLFTLFGIVVGGFLGAGFSGVQWPGILLGALLGALAIGWPIYRRERKRNDCTYVGAAGIARFSVGGSKSSAPKGEIFLFANAVDLQTAFLGRNSGTNFNYQWKNEKGKTLYKLEGGYFGNRKEIDPRADFHFARAAEEAWTRFFLPKVQAELQRTGSCRFLTRRGISGPQHVVIGPGYLDVITGEKTYHNPTADIDDIVLFHGYVIIRRKDAQKRAIQALDGSHGIFYLSYGVFSNVRIFLALLPSVVGVTSRDGE